MKLDTPAGSVELDEADIPEDLRPRARAWFIGQVLAFERAHGSHWAARKDWLLDCLRAELRDLVQRELALPRGGEFAA